MNIGMILPAAVKDEASGIFEGLVQAAGYLIFGKTSIEIQRVELIEGLELVLCSVPIHNREELNRTGTGKKLRAKLDKVFEDERAWPVLEHPDLKGLYNSQEYQFREVLSEIAVVRFPEVLKLIQGVGDISSKEITVTGKSNHLEYAISKLITKVKTLNILLPEGSQSPDEAEQAFEETGIPVHITTDDEVLKRSAVWLRFPEDNESFDVLPEKYIGMIADFGNMKIIDTKNKKIFNVLVEFSDDIKRTIGHNILNSFGEGVLESVIITVCANAWDTTCTEASLKLGMRLSFKS